MAITGPEARLPGSVIPAKAVQAGLSGVRKHIVSERFEMARLEIPHFIDIELLHQGQTAEHGCPRRKPTAGWRIGRHRAKIMEAMVRRVLSSRYILYG